VVAKIHFSSVVHEEMKVHTQMYTPTVPEDTGVSDISLSSSFLAGSSLHNVWDMRSSCILHGEISYPTKPAVLNVRPYRELLNH